MAAYYDIHRNNKDDYKVALFPFIFVFIIFAFVTIQPDLGSALIILLLSFAIFFGVPLLPQVKENK